MPKSKPTPKPGPTRSRPHRITVELSDDEAARLEFAASQRGVSRSDIIRRGVREYPHPTHPAAGGATRRA